MLQMSVLRILCLIVTDKIGFFLPKFVAMIFK